MEKLNVFILCLFVFSHFKFRVSAEDSNTGNEENDVLNVDTTKFVGRCYNEKGFSGILNCVALRALKIVNRVSSQPRVELAPGVALISENSEQIRELRSISEQDLPANSRERAMKLTSLLLEEALHFFDGKVLKIKMPEKENIARALDEGRGRVKRIFSPIALGLIAKSFIIAPLIITALGFFTVKAFIIAKIAIIAAIFAFFSYFFGGRGIGYPGYPGFGGYPYGTSTNTIGTAQYPYNKRSFEDDRESAQNMAYSAQKPQ